jgi:hypothetical protein
MTYDDFKEGVERAELSWQRVNSGASAEDTDWGFFSYGDAPAALAQIDCVRILNDQACIPQVLVNHDTGFFFGGHVAEACGPTS